MQYERNQIYLNRPNQPELRHLCRHQEIQDLNYNNHDHY